MNMKISEDLYNNILNTIDKTIQRTLFEYEQFNSNNDFIIKEYNRVNQEDFNYISINRKNIWEFFDRGYKAVGLNGFCNSCFNSDSLRKNFNKIKLVYYNDILIAGSIYTGRNNGYKCVGITATCDDSYREIGKKAIEYIIRQDIGLYKDFYWGVFDGAVSHYYEKFGGILIPNEYCHMFITAEKDPNDDYKIIIKLSDGTEVSKLIYGFNSKETFNEIIKNNDDRIKKQIEKLEKLLNGNLNESNYKITEHEYHVRIINMFYDDFLNGRQTLTPYMISLIKKSMNFLIHYLQNTENVQNKGYYKLAIENAKDILKYSTKMKIYKF